MLAGLVVKRGNFLEAERLFVAAIATMENRPPREEYAFALRGHARLLTRRKAYKEAEERYAETLKTWEALKMQKKHPIVQVIEWPIAACRDRPLKQGTPGGCYVLFFIPRQSPSLP